MATMARRRSRAQKQNHPPPVAELSNTHSDEKLSPAIISVEPRQRAQPTNTTTIAATPTTETASMTAQSGWSLRQQFEKAAYIIEEPYIVTFFLLIVYVDIILGSMSFTGGINRTATAIVILRHMILYVQCIELFLQMILFHVRFFSHWGYCFDTILVIAKLCHGQYTLDIRTHHLHLLSFLRVWRFIRVVQSYLAIEISRHNHTKGELSALMEYTTEYKRKIVSAEEDIAILNEALTVAALDAAEMRRAAATQFPIYHTEGSSSDNDVVEATVLD